MGAQQEAVTEALKQNNKNSEAAAPKLANAVVERQRVLTALDIGRQIGRVEQSLSSAKDKLENLPGKLPASVANEWGKIEKRVSDLVENVTSGLGKPGFKIDAVKKELSDVQSSLAVINGSLELSSNSQPQIGLPAGPIIAYDPEDVAGIAALQGIISLAQDPKKVDALLQKIGVDKRVEGEGVGRAIQKKMIEEFRKINPQSTPAMQPNTRENVVKPEKTIEPIKPDSGGNYIRKKKVD